MSASTLARRQLLMLAGTLAGSGILSAFGQEPKPAYSKETYTYKRLGALEIKADVYRAAANQAQPAILWIHGGALIMASRTLTPSHMERYLAAGFAVVSIDYRLAPEAKLPAIVEDVEDAYTWVRSKGPELFNIDPDRIAVMGMSAGAYLTQVAGFRLKPRPKALVSFYGYGDITGAWLSQPNPGFNRGGPPISRESTFAAVSGSVISGLPESGDPRRGDFNVYCRRNGLWTDQISGHDPRTEQAWFSSYEPRRNITEDYPPILLLHGESDADVPFKQSVLTAQTLADHHVEHEFISNPQWGHAFDYAASDPAIQQARERVLDFLNKHLKQ